MWCTTNGQTDGWMDGQMDEKGDILRWVPHLKIYTQTWKWKMEVFKIFAYEHFFVKTVV